MKAWIRQVIPDVRLSDETFAVRHRTLRTVLTVLIPVVVAAAAFQGRIGVILEQPHAGHPLGVAIVWSMVAATVACAVGASVSRSRLAGSLVVSLGLLLGSAALVHAGGGLTDLHFAFFVALGLISLYHEWLALVMSVGLITVHHMLVGIVVPGLLFSDVRAWQHPVLFALLHAVLVLAMCAVQLAYWRFIHRAQVEMHGVQVRAAEELRRREERYRALVQDSCDVISVVDGDGVIDSVSSAVEAVMGYRPEELEGTSYYALIHPDDVIAVRRFPGNGAVEQRAEVRARHADGTWHWHDVTLRDLTDRPAVGGIVISPRDVSGRQQLELELRHAQKLESVGRLAAGIAHEINTPIQFIGDNIRFLEHAFRGLRKPARGVREGLRTCGRGPRARRTSAEIEADDRAVDIEYLGRRCRGLQPGAGRHQPGRAHRARHEGLRPPGQ